MERKIVKRNDIKDFVLHYLENLLREHLDIGEIHVHVWGTEIVAHVPVKDYEEAFAKLLSHNVPAEISNLTCGYIIYAYTCKDNPACGKEITIGFAHFYEFAEANNKQS